MTVLKATRQATKHLSAPLDKDDPAGWACLFPPCASRFPPGTDGTRPAAQRATACCLSALGAMLGVFRWAGDGAAVNFLVAGDTYRHAVAYVKCQLGIIREWLDVMGVQIVSFFAATLTGVAISLENGFAPFRQFTFELTPLSRGRIATFPDWRRFSGAPLNDTFRRTELHSRVAGIKEIAASFTRPEVRHTSVRPAFPRAIFGGICAVFFALKFLPANGTDNGDLGVFHMANCSTQHKLLPMYIAITPELID